MSKDGDERPLQSEAECDSFSEPVPSGDALCKNGDPTIADRKALEEFAMYVFLTVVFLFAIFLFSQPLD